MCSVKDRVPLLVEENNVDVQDNTNVLWRKILKVYPSLKSHTEDFRKVYGCIPVMWDSMSEELVKNCESSLYFLWLGIQIMLRCWQQVENARKTGEKEGFVIEVGGWEVFNPRCPIPGPIWEEGKPWTKPPSNTNIQVVWCEEFAILESRTEILRRGYWRGWAFVHPGNIRLRKNDTKLRKRDNSVAECFPENLPSGLDGLKWVPIRGGLILIKVREYAIWRGKSQLVASYWELRTRIDIADMWASSLDRIKMSSRFFARKHHLNL